MQLGFTEMALAVAAGNMITLLFAWGLFQIHKHDYQAPWSAYGAVLIPIFLIVGNAYLNGAIAEQSPPTVEASTQ